MSKDQELSGKHNEIVDSKTVDALYGKITSYVRKYPKNR